jgi:hypothetical protein
VLGTPGFLTFLKVRADENRRLLGGRNVNREALLGYLGDQEAVRRRQRPFSHRRLSTGLHPGLRARIDDIAGMGIALVEMACWDIVGRR